jgi:hypothetical protein
MVSPLYTDNIPGGLMRYVKGQYDAQNRKFKMTDTELATELEDGGLYLVADFSEDDFLPPSALSPIEGMGIVRQRRNHL